MFSASRATNVIFYAMTQGSLSKKFRGITFSSTILLPKGTSSRVTTSNLFNRL
ncbi:hypothetical protein OIDMADRAFT_20604 [Oidiodendron maius Zn]|uniref:Uncharacterized protein n=1 Tax=Oidiodendron maius (strain Zn) TaxID=913774 RepID=A0A0C3D6K3_OIDMZ|nr:hypothetical protein OIDMADRAFT_20604 [Oidiodendron maius Zn]